MHPLVAVGPVLGWPWDFLVAASLVVSAVGLLWTKLIRPTIRAFGQADKYGPILADIAEKYHDPTLEETLARMEDGIKTRETRLTTIEAEIKAQDRRMDRIQSTLERRQQHDPK